MALALCFGRAFAGDGDSPATTEESTAAPQSTSAAPAPEAEDMSPGGAPSGEPMEGRSEDPQERAKQERRQEWLQSIWSAG